MSAPKTYRFSSLQELVDVVPADRIRDCMEELGTIFGEAKGATIAAMKVLGVPEEKLPARILKLPPVLEWIDDGKRDLGATFTAPDGTPLADMTIAPKRTTEAIIADLESKGLGWDIGHTGNLIECRIWKWPDVIGRYRPTKLEPLADMLTKALATMEEETDAR